MSDVATAMAEAKQAAGDKDVLVHGAGTAQLALAAGVLDEIEIHLIPVLLGQGRRLFDNLAPEHIELERTRVLEGDGVTHLRYRRPALTRPSRLRRAARWSWVLRQQRERRMLGRLGALEHRERSP